MKKNILIIGALFLSYMATAQVLYTETFDNLTLGNFTADPTAVTPGQNNWYVRLTGLSDAKIVQEPTKGNVLAVEKTSIYNGGFSAEQKKMQNLWNNRTAGNNILLTEYDFYEEDTGADNQGTRFTLTTTNNEIIDMILQKNYDKTLQVYENTLSINLPEQKGIKYKNINYYNNKWLTIRFYIDYNANKVYFYIPSLGILHTASITNTITNVDEFYLAAGTGTGSNYIGIVQKFDNVRLTALKTLPPEVLSAETFLAKKFNVYPNPATNVVTVTNSENSLVKQVAVYDVSGKLLSTQTFNNETEIQLNVENLASGAYLLHLQTTEGTVVKKLVKK